MSEIKKNPNYFDPCTFCSVKMFGTGTYTGNNGETVYFDFVKPKDLDAFCKKHCSFRKNIAEFTICTNGAFERSVDKCIKEYYKQ